MTRLSPLLSLGLLALVACKAAPSTEAPANAAAPGPAPIGIAQTPATLQARRIERPRRRATRPDARPDAAPIPGAAPATTAPPRARPAKTRPPLRRVKGPAAVVTSRRAPSPSETRARVKGPRGPPIQRFDDVEIRHYETVVFRGTIDLTATVDRILRGERHRHRNDGGVFGNRERRLPRRPRGYYREYVHPTRGRRGPGPQRIIVGEGGDWYYTPDHYKTFRPMQ